MASLVITIDGPAASGKSTAAKLLAGKIGATFLDTGAMYRAVTLAAMENNVDMSDEDKLAELMDSTEFEFSICAGKMTASIAGVDVTEDIRREDVTANAKYIASKPKLRARLVEMQRRFAAGEKKIVTEGRDQGTVAFPDADFKFFLVADAAERARRRFAELRAKGIAADLQQIKTAIEKRDKSDERRAAGPLKPAEDSIMIDTTDLTIEEMVAGLLSFIEKND